MFSVGLFGVARPGQASVAWPGLARPGLAWPGPGQAWRGPLDPLAHGPMVARKAYQNFWPMGPELPQRLDVVNMPIQNAKDATISPRTYDKSFSKMREGQPYNHR